MTSTKEFLGKIALVTGAGRGIGLAIARRFAEAGARVLIADVSRERGTQAVQDLRTDGHTADFIEVDLSIQGGARAMVSAVEKLTGRCDILVNNARAGKRLSMLEETEENWELSLTVGLKAAFFASQAVIRLMAGQGGSRIVNIGSVAATQVTQEAPAYHASKAGLLQITKYLAVSGGEHQARVNCILPGLIIQDERRARFDSQTNAAYRALALSYQPMKNVGDEKDVAEAVLFLCSDRAKYVSGACLALDGAATAQEPFNLLLKSSKFTN